MRSTIIGIVLGVAFIAALFGVAQLYPHAAQGGLQDIASGYVGGKMVGPWQFVCVKDPSQAPVSKAPIPFTLNPNPHGGAAAMAAAQQTALGRCRASLIYRRKGEQNAGPFLVVSFRYTRIGDKLTVIVRFQPIPQVQKGDKVLLQVGDKALPLAVEACGPQTCIAANMFAAPGQNLLLNARQGILIIPAKKDVKPLKIRVPLTGLKDLLDAMRRAEG